MVALTAQIPSSKRSRDAIKRNLPTLQKEFSKKGLLLGSNVFMRIFKKSNELEVWVKSGEAYKLFKNYSICYYSGDLGTKTKQGDSMAPEGFYKVNPSSSYHLSFNIGYPNTYDRQHGYTGSAICVHGDCVSIGCFAIQNIPIEELFTLMVKAFESGQKYIQVHSFPFRMKDETMKIYKNSKWINFWSNLKEGYDWFEAKHVPPIVGVKNKQYTFK